MTPGRGGHYGWREEFSPKGFRGEAVPGDGLKL